MEVTIDKRYPIPASKETCWQVLSNIIELATCMPGATISEQVDATNYKGNVKVKVGPATAAFAGDIEVREIDAIKNLIRMMGKGADRAGSSASMELTASLEAQADGTTILVGKADVIVNGKFAQYGGRMMTSVSDMIIGQFADNFSVKAQSLSAEQKSNDAVIDEAHANASVPAAPIHTEINGLAIVWMLIKDFFKGIFGNKSA